MTEDTGNRGLTRRRMLALSSAAAGTAALGGVAADVGPDEQLYLMLTSTADMFAGHGSTRTPGVVVLEDLVVNVPLVDE